MTLTIEEISQNSNDEAVSALISPTPPFDFKQSMKSLKESGAIDQTDVLDENLDWLERPLLLNGKPFLVRLTNFSTNQAEPRLQLTLWADDNAAEPPNEADLRLAAEWANRRFFLDVDMEKVREALKVDSYGEELSAIYWPSRPGNLGGAWEGLLKTVISNQVYPGLAVQLQKGLLAFYGSLALFKGKEYRLFPSVEKLAALQPDDLLGMKFSRQKASYLPGIAQMIEANPDRFDFERLRGLPGEEAVAILDELPGVGPWTAHYVAMRGLPHLDVFIDEQGLRKTLGVAYNHPATLSNDEFSNLTKIFAPYRTFACYYTYMKMYNV